MSGDEFRENSKIPHLVVSGDSRIGAEIVKRLGAVGTTRRFATVGPGRPYFNLLDSPPATLPPAEITYFCSGVNGFKAVIDDPHSWEINVAGTVRAAKMQVIRGGRVVLLSSCASETHSEALYGAYKLATEIGFRQFGQSAAVYRFGPVNWPGRSTYPNGEYQPLDVERVVERVCEPFSPGLHRVLS